MARYRTQVEHGVTRVTVVVVAADIPQKTTHRVTYQYRGALCDVPRETWTWTEALPDAPPPLPPSVPGTLIPRNEQAPRKAKLTKEAKLTKKAEKTKLAKRKAKKV